MFLSPWFALAGLVLAAGPIAIHLLNRQRFRVVPWAAMDFLRHAVRRSRRMMRLQDLILLALRTAVVLLFGLAMARPFLPGSGAIDPDQPVHAVLVVDNSLSMSYQQLGGTVLDQAKSRAEEFLRRLPPGSRMSVLPACGAAREFNRGAYSTPADALDALRSLEPVDRAAAVSAAIDLAREACDRVKSPPAKQIYFFSDQQAGNWPAQSLEAQLRRLPAPLNVVQTAPREEEVENAWVADLRLQDEIADLETPATFLATLRFEGAAPRNEVQVALNVDGVTVATQTIDLQPGQTREVRFPPYQFNVPVEPGRPTFVPVSVALPRDRLPADDERFLAAPVVASLPVVFADALGPEESPPRGRFGETFRLRRLVAPVTARNQGDKQLVQVRHVRIDRIDRELLKEARLVVIAGVAKPQTEIDALREYVQQGGPLVLACGGAFDAQAWTTAAWQDGLGVLPAPLKPVPVGGIPGTSSGRYKPFQLDFSTLVHDYFLLEQTPREELEELYRLPFFFKAVEVDWSQDVADGLVANVAKRIANDRDRLAQLDKRLAALEAKGAASDGEHQERIRLQQERDALVPAWLAWAASRENVLEDTQASPEELARRERPRVLGRYTNGLPFLVERRIGRGRVLFFTTGVFREWNTLTATNAALLFDRVFRDLILGTLPLRTIDSHRELVVPVPADFRDARFTLSGPHGRDEPVPVDALGGDRYGVRLAPAAERGIYRLAAHATAQTPQAAEGAKLFETILAVNGPADESDLKTLDQVDLQERMASADYRWVAQGETLQLAGAPMLGQDLWKWLMLAVLAGLLAELGMLAWPMLARERTA